MRIAVVGGTGALGRRTVARLLERGHDLRVLVRPEGRGVGMAHERLATVAGDIFDASALARLVAGCDAVLHLATAIPAPGPSMDWQANDRVRREGTARVVEAAAAAGVARTVVQSIAMLTAGRGAEWVDEDTPVATSPVTASAADLEAIVSASRTPWVILRGGLFYGAGGLVAGWQAQAKQGVLRAPGDGGDFCSFVHVTDMARAVVAATEGSATHCIANVVDDRPLAFAEACAIVGAANGQPEVPAGAPQAFRGFRARNDAIKRLFGWRPLYPTLLSGLADA